MEYKNVPPKDIQNAIWGSCFGYEDFDKKVDGKTIRDRIYNTWQRIHLIVQDSPDWFINYIKNNEVDHGTGVNKEVTQGITKVNYTFEINLKTGERYTNKEFVEEFGDNCTVVKDNGEMYLFKLT